MNLNYVYSFIFTLVKLTYFSSFDSISLDWSANKNEQSCTKSKAFKPMVAILAVLATGSIIILGRTLYSIII